MQCLTLTTPIVIRGREEREETAEMFEEDSDWAEAEKVTTKNLASWLEYELKPRTQCFSFKVYSFSVSMQLK